jgi:SAM-dependent methyltransferase
MSPSANLGHANTRVGGGVRADGPATFGVEEGGWWVEERAAWISERVGRIAPRGGLVLDVGCGPGTLIGSRRPDGLTVVNVDSFRWPGWVPTSDDLFVRASADALPFRDGAFDVVGSFDMLEHLPQDVPAMAEQSRVARANGTVVAAVPASATLWSAYDELVGHHRRYDRAMLHELGVATGLRCRRASHFFAWLWLPAWLLRKRASRNVERGNSDGVVSRAVRAVIHVLCATERWLLRRRMALPFGTSIWSEFEHRDSIDESVPPRRLGRGNA